MTASSAWSRLLLLAVVGLLASCAASTPQTRIARNPDLFASLTPAQQEIVSRGRIERGLPMDGVFLAWGRPDRVVEWDRSGSRVQRWTYLGLQPVHTYTFGWSGGWGGWHGWDPYCDPYFFGGPSVEWVPYPMSRVDFRHGKVTEWEVRLTRP
ncbi:MAG: hypothetical protein ACKV19_14620 [Verrucomicrobiales bacterium]